VGREPQNKDCGRKKAGTAIEKKGLGRKKVGMGTEGGGEDVT
jgi:hypothetical protein